MLTVVPADETDLSGKALEVRYQKDPSQPDRLLVNITARDTDCTTSCVHRIEIGYVAITAPMSLEAMRERVEIEAERRAIARVAWIEER